MIESTIQSFRFMRSKQPKVDTNEQTRQRMGLAQRSSDETAYRMQRARQEVSEGMRNAYNPAQQINVWANELDALRSERQQRALENERSTTRALSEEPRPQRRYPQRWNGGNVEVPGNLMEDAGFTSAVENLASRFGIDTSEVYAVIQGESAFNPQARNPSGATGLFQFMPATAEELGVSTEDIMGMSPTEQVELYGKYLERWNYDGSNRLGIMQAAPAFADKGEEDIIYAKGSAAWEQNPGWREFNDGPITVRSINAYYARNS